MRAPWQAPRRFRAAAAAVLLLGGGYLLGSAPWKSSEPRREGPRPKAPVVEASGHDELEPLVEIEPGLDGGLLTLARFEESLDEAERDGLRSQLGREQRRAARLEVELAARPPADSAPVQAQRVVAAFAERVRHAVTNAESRKRNSSSRDLVRSLRIVGERLRLDRDAAFPVIRDWVDDARSPGERAMAVRLLASVGGPLAFDVLAREARAGENREAALDGLLASRETRSRPVFQDVLADPSAPVTLQIRAAGGLHRLGDPAGLAFLVETFGAHPESAPTNIRRRIVYLVADAPSPEALAIMPELIDGTRLDSRERLFLADWLLASGAPGVVAIIDHLVASEPNEKDRARIRQLLER